MVLSPKYHVWPNESRRHVYCGHVCEESTNFLGSISRNHFVCYVRDVDRVFFELMAVVEVSEQMVSGDAQPHTDW